MSHNARRFVLGFSVVLCLCLLAGSPGGIVVASPQEASSMGADPALLKLYQWRSIGPDRGGRSLAVSGVLGRPREGYFGATGGGLWKTTGRRRDVGAGDRRPDRILVGRRGRRGRDQPGRGVHRHGRVVHPRQHPAGRRRVQVDRRRQDLDARRSSGTRRTSRRSASTRPIRRSSSWRRSASTACRTTNAASSRAPTADGRGGGCCSATIETGAVDLVDRPTQSDRGVRRAVGSVPHGIHDVERRAGQRPVQVDRWRRDVDRDHAQPGHAVRPHRPHRRLGVGRGLESRLRARRKRKRRPVQLERRRRDVGPRQQRAATSASARSTTRTSRPTRPTGTPSTS